MIPVQGVEVRFLVRELSSQVQHSMAKIEMERLCPGICPPIAHSPSKGSFPATGLWWLFSTSQLCLPPWAMADWTKDRYPSCLSQLTLVTKYHRMGGLKNRHLFLILLEARESKINVPSASVPNALSLTVLQILYVPFTASSHREGRGY